MATETTERLQVLVESRVTDFDKGMRSVERRMAKMERQLSGDLKTVERASRNAARVMEREFDRSTSRIEAQFAGIRTAARAAMAGLGAIGIGVGAFSLGAAVSSINRQTAAIADLRAEARRAGVEFEAFQRIKFAGEQQRVSIDAITDGLKELQLRADEFIVTGKGSGAEAFQRLGYTAKSLATAMQDPVAAFDEIIGKIADLDGRGAQIRVSDELFGGTGGEQFVQILANVRQFREDMGKASVLTDQTADNADEVNRRFNEIANVIGTRLNTNLTDTAALVLDIGDTIAGWSTAAEKFLNSLGNSSVFRDLNMMLAENGLMNTDGLTVLDPALAGAVRQSDLEDARALVAQLESDLALVNEGLALPEADRGGFKIEEMTRAAERLKQELEAARAALAAMENIPSITVTPAAGATGDARAFLSGRRADGNENVGRLTEAAAAGAAAVLSMPEFAGINIGSAYRSPEHNAAVGGARNSRHTHGDALDFSGVNASNVGALVRALQAQGFRGFGYYNNGSLHADMGAQRAWGPDRTARSLGQTPAEFRAAVGAPAPAMPTTRPAPPVNIDAGAEQREAEVEARRRQAEAIARVNEQIARGIELAQIESELRASGQFTSDEITAALEREREVRQALDELKAAGVEVSPQMEEAIRREIDLKYELIAANEKLQGANADQVARIGELKNAFASLGESALDEFFAIIDGSKSAEDAIKSLLQQLAKTVLQGALFGSGPLGGLFGGGLLGSLFPARATGGPVSGRQPYMVGERGRELFVPDGNGRILDAQRTRSLLDQSVFPRTASGVAGGGGRVERLQPIVEVYFDERGLRQRIREEATPIAQRESRRAESNAKRAVPSIAQASQRRSQLRNTTPSKTV